MECPYCSDKTKVTDKRRSPHGVRRRRECLKCKKRFTTHEKIVQHDFYIIKKDKSREKFSREKLDKGIEKAFEKRPVSKEKIEKMINEIEEQLRKRGKKEIPWLCCCNHFYMSFKRNCSFSFYITECSIKNIIMV